MALRQGNLVVKPSAIHGLGVFADEDFVAGELVEACHLLIVDISAARGFRDYTFNCSEYPEYINSAMVALGNGSIYNHSVQPNAYSQFDPGKQLLNIVSTRPIRKGEEICIDYGGSWFADRNLQMANRSKLHTIRRFLFGQRRLWRCAFLVTALLGGVVLLQTSV